jgi:hypothetical protein
MVCPRSPGGGEPTATYGILSLHWNGYAREEAVQRLGGCEPGLAAPFVLLRLNDWVREVREAASAVVAAWLERGELLPLALNLPLIERMAGPVRGRREGLVEEIEARLLTEQPPTALRTACRSEDRSVCREAFSVAFRATKSGNGWALDEGLASADPVVGLRALRMVAGGEQPGVDMERVRRALADPFMPVRREALQALAVAAPELGREALQRAVLDRHPAVRYLARWHLERMGVEDFSRRYREVLEGTPSRGEAAAALGGLGEVGVEEDLLTVAPYLEAPAGETVRVRAAAVRTWAKLGGDAEVWGLLEHVSDESPKVAREAARAVRDRLHLVGAEQLLGCYFRMGKERGRREILHLIARLPVGDRLQSLLRVAAVPGEPLAQEALELVGVCVGRTNLGYLGLTASQVASVRRGMEAVGERLGEGGRGQLELLLRGCAR